MNWFDSEKIIRSMYAGRREKKNAKLFATYETTYNKNRALISGTHNRIKSISMIASAIIVR